MEDTWGRVYREVPLVFVLEDDLDPEGKKLPALDSPGWRDQFSFKG